MMHFTPHATQRETITLTEELATRYDLFSWGSCFRLGTAGYRDLLDPLNLFSSEVPFNALSVALLAYARAEVLQNKGITSLHIGGEVRPHTAAFIDLVSRIYAARGIACHLRSAPISTTPIWLSSFGVFHYGLGGGENFTASHSQNYKGGWKPMDGKGMQLIEMATEIADQVREVLSQVSVTPVEIPLASAASPLITRDFDPLEAYSDTLVQIVGQENIDAIRLALESGLRVAISTEGGSMGATARALFTQLRFPMDQKGITFLHEAEDQRFHGIGILDGVNHGVDPGKWQVYKHVGAQELLRTGAAHVVFIWDPDGDRFNMVTTAPKALEEKAREGGLETDHLTPEEILVYFKPNQIYFLLTALLMEQKVKSGDLDEHDWIVAITYPTSRSIVEVAQSIALKAKKQVNALLVPVGFKHFGDLVGQVEAHLDEGSPTPFSFVDATGTPHNLGSSPRFLIMAEESGGAAMGTGVPIPSRDGTHRSIALKEKDGMQVGVTTLALMARLYAEGGSFAQAYLDLLEEHQITYRFYERRDITLYDESLKGEERAKAKAEAEKRKMRTVSWFQSLTTLPLDAARERLKEKTGPGFPTLERALYAGDGTLLEFEGAWFEIRASGTDAVLRFYFEGKSAQQVRAHNALLASLTF